MSKNMYSKDLYKMSNFREEDEKHDLQKVSTIKL